MSTSWQDVTVALLARWPAQKWDREQLAGYIAELQVDGLTPEKAMAGLRASKSAFVPAVGEVMGLYWSSLPPVSTADLVRAEELQRERFEAKREQWMLEQEAETDLPALDEGSA